jgi:hypothetical protein
MPANETSFKTLVDIPVHYDRLRPPFGYGSKGKLRNFECRKKLKNTLEDCFKELFALWGRDAPSLILSAGTIGDGENAHGQGFAFDLDGFYWGDLKFMMIDYPADREFYLGVNAHLFLYFSQVLSYHYPNHRDHFHVDFNFSSKFRPESNAQTFFLQACLKYVFDRDIGNTGADKDGVDGIFGGDTEAVLKQVLKDEGLPAKITTESGWRKFLLRTRERAFAIA